MTSSTMAWLTRMRETSASGVPVESLVNVPSPHDTKPSGAFLRWILRCFLTSSPALRTSRAFSMSCSGASTMTWPTVSNPARPARPAICWNSRTCSWRCRTPSYFDRPLNSTVRIGTLMPTPSVSVPQTTLSSPAWVSVSTSRR